MAYAESWYNKRLLYPIPTVILALTQEETTVGTGWLTRPKVEQGYRLTSLSISWLGSCTSSTFKTSLDLIAANFNHSLQDGNFQSSTSLSSAQDMNYCLRLPRIFRSQGAVGPVLIEGICAPGECWVSEEFNIRPWSIIVCLSLNSASLNPSSPPPTPTYIIIRNGRLREVDCTRHLVPSTLPLTRYSQSFKKQSV